MQFVKTAVQKTIKRYFQWIKLNANLSLNLRLTFLKQQSIISFQNSELTV